MDDLDRALLAQLTMDARVPLATLARRLKVARSTVQTRIERLEGTGAIAGYTVKLGEGLRGGLIRASVLVTIEPRNQAAILARLRAIPEVERAHTTSGLDAVLDVIGEIPGVRSSESLIHLSTRIDRAL